MSCVWCCTAVDPDEPESAEFPQSPKSASVSTSSTSCTVIESADGSIARVNQYEFERALGRGTSGAHVYLARAGSMNYAIKMYSKSMLKKRRLGQSGDKFAAVMNEINVMRRLQHPNIIRLHEVIDDPERDELFIVMEFAERGSLFQGKDVEEPYSESDTRNLFRDIVSGLEFMHSHQVAHRDIKPENCLRMRDGTVKLSDFGASLHFHSVAEENVTSTEGTAAFMAPEMCQGLFSTTDQAPSFSVCNADIWSAGVSLFNLLFGRVPFDARSVMKMYEAIVQQPLKIPERPAISAECAELLSRMLEKDPAKRANWAEIRNHPWLTEFGKRPMPPMPGADDSTAQSTTAGIVMTSVVLPGASD